MENRIKKPLAVRVLEKFRIIPIREMSHSTGRVEILLAGMSYEYACHICRCILGQDNRELNGWKHTVSRQLHRGYGFKMDLDKSPLVDAERVRECLTFEELARDSDFEYHCINQKAEYPCLSDPGIFDYFEIFSYYKAFITEVENYRQKYIKRKGEFTISGIKEILNEFLERCWNTKKTEK